MSNTPCYEYTNPNLKFSAVNAEFMFEIFWKKEERQGKFCYWFGLVKVLIYHLFSCAKIIFETYCLYMLVFLNKFANKIFIKVLLIIFFLKISYCFQNLWSFSKWERSMTSSLNWPVRCSYKYVERSTYGLYLLSFIAFQPILASITVHQV